MKISEFNLKKVYSEASGVCAVVDENIRMELNDFGMYEEKALLAGDFELSPLVEFVSPYLNEKVTETEISEKLYGGINGISYDKRLGYYKGLYAGFVKEGNYRVNGSSGGMGTWIIKELFEKKLIDGVIHVKENTDKNSTILFKYEISRSIEGILDGAKTKYYPVEFSSVLKKVKSEPGRYAIVGIPSFIMAIRLLAEKDEVIKKRIKYTIGLVCGHQKSSKFAEALAWQVGIQPDNLKHINFRKKLIDKPANNYGVEMIGLINGEEVKIVKPIKEMIGQNWGQGFFKTLASDFSDDVMNETADITLGDAWLSEYTNDGRGNNIIVVRHPLMHELIKDGIKSDRLHFDEVDNETIFRSQAAHYRHTHDELAYRLYKKDSIKKWRPNKRVLASNEIPFFRKKVQDLRERISTRSHIVYKQSIELNDFSSFKREMQSLTRMYILTYKLMNIINLGFKGFAIKLFKKTRAFFLNRITVYMKER